MIGNSDDETNFSHKLLLTNGQVENHRKDWANYLSADIKLSKTQLSKIIESSRFLGKLLGPLLKTGTINGEHVSTISEKHFNTIKINCSSIGSGCRNTFKKV